MAFALASLRTSDLTTETNRRFTDGGLEVAIRVETLYWLAAEDCARDKGITLERLVLDVLAANAETPADMALRDYLLEATRARASTATQRRKSRSREIGPGCQ